LAHGQPNSLLAPAETMVKMLVQTWNAWSQMILTVFMARQGLVLLLWSKGMLDKEMINDNEVNFMKVRHFNLPGLLDNNDINVTAFAIGVSEGNRLLSFEFQVSLHFW
jgi:hypothetical protein